MLEWEYFKDKFHESWWRFMRGAIESEYMDDIYKQLKALNGKETVCPSNENVFRSFSWNFDDIKTVLVLSDPYPWVKGNPRKPVIFADGLPMSCSITGSCQPSLEKFYEAMGRELGFTVYEEPDLSYLAERGVFLINTALTCKAKKVGSHGNLWLPFMQYLFEDVLEKKTGIIYWLMGKEAARVEKWINPLANYIFKTTHPASAEHNKQDWDSKGMFKLINKILVSNNGTGYQIQWHKS